MTTPVNYVCVVDISIIWYSTRRVTTTPVNYVCLVDISTICYPSRRAITTPVNYVCLVDICIIWYPTRRYLYHLVSYPESDHDGRNLRLSPVFGHLNLAWKNDVERSRLSMYYGGTAKTFCVYE